jgi:glucose-6-phosphate isomerase
MEYNLKNLTPDIRRLSDMRSVVYDKDWLKTASDFEAYYMYRRLKEENGLINNITLISAKLLGSEFMKTKGHIHIGNYGEVYTVLEGEAIFFMQKIKEGNTVEDVYAIKAKKGESAVIPSFYGHVTINPSDIDLKTSDWSSISCKSDYSLFEKLGGACYYYTKQGWIKNENYKNIPKLRFEKPLKSLPKDLSFLKGE